MARESSAIVHKRMAKGLGTKKEHILYAEAIAYHTETASTGQKEEGKMVSIKRIISKAQSPISNNQGFYLALILLFCLSIIPIQYKGCSRLRAGFEMFGDVYILCAVISMFPTHVRRSSKYVIYGFLYVIGLADMITYQVMGVPLIPNVVQTWLQTNWNEATEALRTQLSAGLLLTPVALFLVLPLVVYLTKRKLFIHRKLIYSLLLLSFASIAYGIPNKLYLYEVYTRVSDDDMQDRITAESLTHEYLPIYRLGLSVKETCRFSTMREHLFKNVKSTQVDSCSFESPIIVLIIGESYNRHHSSLYDYTLPTTPRQQRRHQEGSLYRFDDVITSYNLTFKSFQNMLTLYNYDSKGPWYDYPVIPAIFKKAGYEVMFFSNQHTLDKTSAISDFTEDMFMNNPDINSYMFDLRNAKSHTYDMDLVNDYLTMADTTARKPQLVVFHFLGIHLDFKQRYPEDEKVFKPSDYAQRNDLNQEEKMIVADYDNAILYNDTVVDSIINVFSPKDAIVIYVPDHGELVYDGVHELGRNLNRQREYILPQFDIPFWVFCSDSYKKHHPHICKQIEASTNRPFMTDDLPHLLLYLGGIRVKAYQRERNLIDEEFNSNRSRRIWGEINYDSIKAA